LHHIGYVVSDLRAGVARFSTATGAGPFFAMEHIMFDEVTYRGEPAIYDHSAAFGQWGPILVELSEVHDAEPAGLRDALVAAGDGVGHVGLLADSLLDEVARLEADGLAPFHTGRAGPASAVWLDGGDLFGHPVEVLERREELLRFYAMVRDASLDWDGSEPLRVLPGPQA
jgi:hypothetical protein